jgi:hypothetical protein
MGKTVLKILLVLVFFLLLAISFVFLYTPQEIKVELEELSRPELEKITPEIVTKDVPKTDTKPIKPTEKIQKSDGLKENSFSKNVSSELGCGNKGEPCCYQLITHNYLAQLWCYDPYSCVGNDLYKNSFRCEGKSESSEATLDLQSTTGKFNMKYYYVEIKDIDLSNTFPLIGCDYTKDCEHLTVPEKTKGKSKFYCASTHKFPPFEGLCLLT